MRRLRGADGQFLYEETRTQHRHTLKIQILDPSTASWDAFDFDAFKKGFEEGISPIPPLHWRLVKVPLGIDHPSWAYDPKLDIDYHVRRAAVPRPGGAREFCEVVSEIASTGLERDRPLWQLWLVEGLEGGRIAFVTKLHHAVADGVSSAQILLDAFQDSPEGTLERPPHAHRVAEVVPGAWSRFVDGVAHSTRVLARSPRMAWRVGRVMAIAIRRARAGQARPAAAFSAPATRFNRKLTPHRIFANVDVPLADMKRVKDALGGTLNDVYVALCAGALRRYLGLHDELPAESLTASIPVSVRREEERRSYGNRVATWYVSLATDVEDPVARYRAIRASTAAARESFEAKDPELLSDFMDYWWVWRALQGATKLVTRLTGRPVYNLILSNVRGPERTLYSNGARVVGLRSMGPIVNDLGLNMTGWSYAGTMSVGIVACREHVPDIWTLAEGVPAALDELLAAIGRPEGAAAARAAASGA